MSFTESIKRCMGKKYASIQGRAPMSEFWWFVLYLWGGPCILALIFTGIGSLFNKTNEVMPFYGGTIIVWWLVHIVPSLCVQVRRFHDSGHSGTNIFWVFIPYIGAIWILMLELTSGSKGINKYGYPYPQNYIRFTEQDFVLLSMKLNQANMEVYGAPPCVYGYKCIPLEAIPFIQKWEAGKVKQPIPETSEETKGENTLLFQSSNSNSSSTVIKKGEIICPKCGNAIKDKESMFCRYCGTFVHI